MVLKSGWTDGDVTEMAAMTWVAELKTKLAMEEEIVVEKETKAKHE